MKRYDQIIKESTQPELPQPKGHSFSSFFQEAAEQSYDMEKCGPNQEWDPIRRKCVTKKKNTENKGDQSPPRQGSSVEPTFDVWGSNGMDGSYALEIEADVQEGTLHDWFGKSKSKGGKPGWVQSDGSPCANEKGETKTPKCYSSERLESLKKTEEGKKKIRSADARKSRQDPDQQEKSGGAKPKMVKTFTDSEDYDKHPSGDGRTKKEEVEYVDEAKDVKGEGSGKKDACYHKVKSRFKVFPSAYASGALVQCREKGADNWGNSTKNEEVEEIQEAPKRKKKCVRCGSTSCRCLGNSFLFGSSGWNPDNGDPGDGGDGGE